MPDYTNHSLVVETLLPEAQDASSKQRVQVREQRDFLHIKDGQWERDVWKSRDKHPRYTIDKTTPLIEDTTGRIKKADFGIKVQPVDSAATEDVADTIAGLMRNSSNISGADHIFNQAVTSVVESGFDGWEVVHDFVDGNSFHQDILFKGINNFVDRVWFDHGDLNRTPENARHAFKLTTFALDDYNEKWPTGSGVSVSQDKTRNSLRPNTDNVVVGQIYYLLDTKTELVLMTNGKVYEVDDDFKKIKDELELEGITEESRRETKTKKQWIRQFDGGGWLKEAEETVFEYISLCPEYGKFAVIDDVITYRGMTLKLMDPQRIYNYARSRQIEEGALAPRDKILATQKQMEGFETEWATMNTNADPALPYNPDPEAPQPPFKIGGSQINPGLAETANNMTQDMQEVANKFSVATPGQMNARSGVVIDELKESSDTGDVDWTEGHEIALCYTFKVWLSGAKKVYDGTRTARILKEDNTFSMEELNTTRLDQQSGEIVTINNLSAGLYSVVCSAGKSYKTRQGETIAGILEIGAVDPSIITEGQDILVAASDGPGMSDIAERIRARKMREGTIPQSQWTDEETQQAIDAQQAAQNQPTQPDPLMIAALAEQGKADAANKVADNKTLEIQGNQKIAMDQIALDNKKIDLDTQKFNREGDDKFNLAAAKIDQGQQNIELKADQQLFDQREAIAQQQSKDINAMFNNLKTLTEVMQGFVGPHVIEAGVNEAVALTEAQEQRGDTSIGEDVAGT